MSGHKIIEGLKEAIAGDFSRVTLEGQTWVRMTPAEKRAASDTVRTISIVEDRAGVFIATSDIDPVMFCAATSLEKVFDAVLRIENPSPLSNGTYQMPRAGV